MKQAVDWKFYDRLNELHSPFERDPRPLETLTEAIIPGCEEDGTSKSNPLPPAHPRLTQPDRQLSESSYVVGTKILLPHRNSNLVSNQLNVNTIMFKAKCTAVEARNLSHAFAILDATPKMVNTYCSQVRERGTETILDYLYRYLIGIVDVEAEPREHTGVDEKEPWEDEPVVAGEKLPGIFGKAGICEDVPLNETEISFLSEDEKLDAYFAALPQGPRAVIVGDKLVWPQADENGNFLIPTPCEDDCEDDIESWDLEPEEDKTTGSTIGYHIVEDLNEWQDKVAAIQRNSDPDVAEWFQFNLPNEEKCNTSEVINSAFDQHCSWESLQPVWYKGLLEEVREANPETIKEIGQKLHNGIEERCYANCSKSQLSVLWTEWKSRKAGLLPRHLGITTRAMLKKIAQANGHLGAVGIWLHKIQNGEIKVSMPPNDIEWGIIWQKYFEAKEAHV